MKIRNNNDILLESVMLNCSRRLLWIARSLMETPSLVLLRNLNQPSTSYKNVKINKYGCDKIDRYMQWCIFMTLDRH